MANISTKKGVIGILTGGGDVPGLNPAIRGVTLRALREGYQVIGIRHGWAGLVDMVREKDYDNSDNFILLDEEIVDRAGRTGGTFLHSSRTNPGRVSKPNVPAHLKDKFTAEKNDLTSEVLKNLAWLGIETLIPIGGDDTLSWRPASQRGIQGHCHSKDHGQRRPRHRLLHRFQHVHHAHASARQQSSYLSRLPRTLHGTRSIRAVCGFYRHAS